MCNDNNNIESKGVVVVPALSDLLSPLSLNPSDLRGYLRAWLLKQGDVFCILSINAYSFNSTQKRGPNVRGEYQTQTCGTYEREIERGEARIEGRKLMDEMRFTSNGDTAHNLKGAPGTN